MTIRQRRFAAFALAVWIAIVVAGALSNKGFSTGSMGTPDSPSRRPFYETKEAGYETKEAGQ